MNNLHKRIGGLKPRRWAHDLSHEKKLTLDMGMLVPTLIEMTIPGDTFKIAVDNVVRLHPMLAPVLQQMDLKTNIFFTPIRLLDENFEKFYTRDVDGEYKVPPPKWKPNSNELQKGTLWDYCGFPLRPQLANLPPTSKALPVAWIKRAYNLIFNEWYRDNNLQDPIDLDSTSVQFRNWEKDYFTSALLSQQRGPIPNIPIEGTASTIFEGSDYTPLGSIGEQLISMYPYPATSQWAGGTSTNQPELNDFWIPHSREVNTSSGVLPAILLNYENGTSSYSNGHVSRENGNFLGDLRLEQQPGGETTFKTSFKSMARPDGTTTNLRQWLNQNRIELSNLAAMNAHDMRYIFQVTKWMERNMRGGVRLTEFLKAHFGVSPKDSRLQRPEYIGGMGQPIIISEVLQTSESSSTPQGTMKGHGLSVQRKFCAKYRVTEPGIIMALTSIMPKPTYQDGIDRQFLIDSTFDMPFPEFVNLSERAIYKTELFSSGDEDQDLETWGYCGIYDEYRIRQSRVSGDFRDTLNYWHLSRIFQNAPGLNEDFIKCDGTTTDMKRIFAVNNVHGFMLNVGNLITAIRPLPPIAEPGLIDHH